MSDLKQPHATSRNLKQPQATSSNLKRPQATSSNLKQPQATSSGLKKVLKWPYKAFKWNSPAQIGHVIGELCLNYQDFLRP